MSTDGENASAGLVCRVQLVDDDVLQDTSDKEDAHVDACIVRDRSVHTGMRPTLLVQCPLHIRLLRKAYVKAIGFALWLVEQQMMANFRDDAANPVDSAANRAGSVSDTEDATQAPQATQARLVDFDVVMSPRAQLNCVIALGCLGYFVDTADARATATRLIVRSEWPNAPSHACAFAEHSPRDNRREYARREYARRGAQEDIPSARHEHARREYARRGAQEEILSARHEYARRGAQEEIPSPLLFQMQTMWSPSDQVFRTSFYDLVCGKFDWVDRLGLFESTVASARSDGTLHLRPLDLAMLRKTDADTPLYAEYARHDGCIVSFFGTAGDVLAKAGLLLQTSATFHATPSASVSASSSPLPDSNARDSRGLASLLKARVYYVKTSMRREVLAVLNHQGRRVARGPQSRDTKAPLPNGQPADLAQRAQLPRLELDHIRWLPQQALRNLGKIWLPSTSQQLRQRVKQEPAFCDAVLASLPVKVLDALKTSCADLGCVAQCLLALAVCPEIMEEEEEEEEEDTEED